MKPGTCKCGRVCKHFLIRKKATIEAGVEPPSDRDRQQNLDVDRFLKAINTF